MADVGQKERIMKILNVTAQEADEILAYDKLVEQGKPTPYDLSPEEERKLRKYRQADRKPTAYKFSQRERKPNATKEGLVVEIATFLAENSSFDAKNVQITNKNREITFTVGEDTFTWTLVQKRKPKP
jgi:hypothetical protein